MGGLFGGNNKKDAARQAAAAQKAAEEQAAKAAAAEKERQEKEQQRRDRDQAYGARGQRLSASLGKDNTYVEEERSSKLGNSAMNYNLLNVKLG